VSTYLPQYNEVAIPFWLVNFKSLNQNTIKLVEKIEDLNDKNLVSYSPIFPAFLGQRKNVNKENNFYCTISSVFFLYPVNTHRVLGFLKSNPSIVDITQVYISNGLASIIVMNSDENIMKDIVNTEIFEEISLMEYWKLDDSGKIVSNEQIQNDEKINIESVDYSKLKITLPHKLKASTIDTYVEQISFCLRYLSNVYQKVLPSEIETLYKQCELINEILSKIDEYTIELRQCVENGIIAKCLDLQKILNSYEAHLVEICASLSYAITQGTSGISPILENPSPFPHQRLLGIGGANKALISFVRNIENAMNFVNAVEVIEQHYSRNSTNAISPNFIVYESDDAYKQSYSSLQSTHQLDQFRVENKPTIPLITHFSLRHGFKESPVSVTAASESLSHEIDPHWTLMTLSHEIMHSRVRGIFDALMKIDNTQFSEHFKSYNNWLSSSQSNQSIIIKEGLRNVIYLFCFNYEELALGENIEFYDNKATENGRRLRECFIKHQMKAIELIVHFHDYFFIFENNYDTYFKSIFISWSKVSAPCNNHEYYLIRCLATAALGSGLGYFEAFDFARERILDILIDLKDQNLDSPFINQCIQTLENSDKNIINSNLQSRLLSEFKISYFLIDQFSYFFSSTILLQKLHFTNTISSNEENIHNVESYGDGKFINPIAYSLASLIKSITNDHQVQDSRWLSSWNSMVVSSYPERAIHAA
jgi:hypothetical protein